MDINHGAVDDLVLILYCHIRGYHRFVDRHLQQKKHRSHTQRHTAESTVDMSSKKSPSPPSFAVTYILELGDVMCNIMDLRTTSKSLSISIHRSLDGAEAAAAGICTPAFNKSSV